MAGRLDGIVFSWVFAFTAAECAETVISWIENNGHARMLFSSRVQTPDVPFGDSFIIHQGWRARACGDEYKVASDNDLETWSGTLSEIPSSMALKAANSISVEFFFDLEMYRSFPMSGIIRSRALQTYKDFVEDWIEWATSKVAEKKTDVMSDGPRARPGDSSNPVHGLEVSQLGASRAVERMGCPSIFRRNRKHLVFSVASSLKFAFPHLFQWCERMWTESFSWRDAVQARMFMFE